MHVGSLVRLKTLTMKATHCQVLFEMLGLIFKQFQGTSGVTVGGAQVHAARSTNKIAIIS